MLLPARKWAPGESSIMPAELPYRSRRRENLVMIYARLTTNNTCTTRQYPQVPWHFLQLERNEYATPLILITTCHTPGCSSALCSLFTARSVVHTLRAIKRALCALRLLTNTNLACLNYFYFVADRQGH